MDIKDIIQDLLARAESEVDFKKEFLSDPVKTIKSVLKADLPEGQLQEIADAVIHKLNLEDASDVLDKFKKKF